MTYLQRMSRYGLFVCFISLSLWFSAVSAQMLSLPEGLKIVAEKSRSISISRSDEQIAEADARIAMAHLLPTVNAAAARTLLAHRPEAIFGPQSVPVSERNFLSYSISVQQTLFDFQGNASRYDASKAILSARKLETERIRNFASIEFVLAYLDLLEDDRMISVAEKEVQALEAHRKKAQSLFDEGVVTRNELLQAEVKISDARQRQLMTKTLRKIHASRLNNILLRPLRTELNLQDIDELQGAGSRLLRLRLPGSLPSSRERNSK